MELDLIEYRSSASINKEISYGLSALINADSLFYGVFDYANTLIWAAKVSFSSISLLFEELAKNGISIQKIKIGIHNSNYTIIPQDEYVSLDAKSLLEHTNYLDSQCDYIIRNEYSEKFGIRLIYGVPQDIIKDINQAFQTSSLVHINYAQFQTMSFSDSGEPSIRVCIYDSTFDITVCSASQLILSNTYNYYTHEDVLYFMGLVFDRLNLDHRNQRIEIGGLITYDSDLLHLLREYFGRIEFATGYFDSDLNNELEHIHLPLYMISQCA